MCIGLKPGQNWPFDQAMASMMMVSANDAAYAIAETVGAAIPRFAGDLNATAKRYGMQDSTFAIRPASTTARRTGWAEGAAPTTWRSPRGTR
jgi:hypothetical protein